MPVGYVLVLGLVLNPNWSLEPSRYLSIVLI